MGDVAVGARSGHDGEEHRGQPVQGVSAAVPAADSAVTSGSDSGATDDGRTPGERNRTEEQGSDGTPPKSKKQRSFWKELPILIGIALVLALLIKTFLVQAFSIPSASMQNTLQVGDRVLVDKLTPWFGSKPERDVTRLFSDASALSRYGIPTLNYGTSTGLMDVELGENLAIDGLVRTAQTYALVAQRICG